MTVIATQIEIAAPPAKVRAKFLDFSNPTLYSPKGFIKSIATKTKGDPLEKGTKMRVELQGTGMEPVLLENNPSVFSWRGALPLGLFTGDHSFRFTPNPSNPNSTIFIQQEDFSGGLAFMIGEGWVANQLGFREKTAKGFSGFNIDLKKVCEEK